MLHRDAPNIDSAYDILDSLISEAATANLMAALAMAGRTARRLTGFTDEDLAGLACRAIRWSPAGRSFRHRKARVGSAHDLDLERFKLGF